LVARYLALQGKQAAAVDLLEKIAAAAKTTVKMAIYIAIQAHHALLLEEMGDEAAAHTLLAQIIEIAQPQGFIRVFVDEGEAMQRLLATFQPLLNPKLQGYVRILLQ